MDLTTSEKVGAMETAQDINAGANRVHARYTSHNLPDKPLITIEPSGVWTTLNLSDIWAYRELLFFLTWRDIKVRYKQTALGAAWAIIQPVLTMLIFTIFFGRLAGLPSDGIPYPLFTYSGLLLWTFFANALTNSSNSLVGSSNLITKIYFPRMIIPASAVAAGLVDLAIAFPILIGLMIYYRESVTWTVVFVPFFILLITLLALGVSMLLSALNVKYRDVRYALPFLIQVWMFASPIPYPASLVPDKWRLVYALNPMTGIIEGFRAVLIPGKALDWQALLISVVVTLLMLVYAAYTFRRMEKTFADII